MSSSQTTLSKPTTSASTLSSYKSTPSRANAQSYYSYHSGLGKTEAQQYQALQKVQNAANLYRQNQRTTASKSLLNYGQRSKSQQRKRATKRKNRRNNRTRRNH